MSRTMLSWLMVSLVALFAGCAMCASPYDYCGPTVTGQCGDECDPNAPRAGSILSGNVVPTLAEGEIMVSSTGSTEDSLLQELMSTTPAESIDAPTIAPAQQGWTSRTKAKSAQR